MENIKDTRRTCHRQIQSLWPKRKGRLTFRSDPPDHGFIKGKDGISHDRERKRNVYFYFTMHSLILQGGAFAPVFVSLIFSRRTTSSKKLNWKRRLCGHSYMWSCFRASHISPSFSVWAVRVASVSATQCLYFLHTLNKNCSCGEI